MKICAASGVRSLDKVEQNEMDCGFRFKPTNGRNAFISTLFGHFSEPNGHLCQNGV